MGGPAIFYGAYKLSDVVFERCQLREVNPFSAATLLRVEFPR